MADFAACRDIGCGISGPHAHPSEAITSVGVVNFRDSRGDVVGRVDVSREAGGKVWCRFNRKSQEVVFSFSESQAKLIGSLLIQASRDADGAKCCGPFTASLFNEACDLHKTVSLQLCPEKIVIGGMKYRLTEFSEHGAAYVFCGFDPTGEETDHVHLWGTP